MRFRDKALPLFLGLLTVALAGAYSFCAWSGLVPFWPLAAGYALMSLLTLAAYAYDKAAERADEGRISEETLHVLGFFCGWPGALLAQVILRHKTQKTFQIVFWYIVLLNSALLFVIWRGGPALLSGAMPSFSLEARVPSLPKVDLSSLLKSVSSSVEAPTESDEEPEKSPEPPAPALDELWAAAPATEPPLPPEPGFRRSRATVNKQGRILMGEVRAVSPVYGLLVTLPDDIGGDGVIVPSALVPDFHRRFKPGERITVSIKGVEMKGSRKQVNLVLVEP